MAGRLARLPRIPLLVLIRVYQLVISPWTASACRYYPSCSQYALVAIKRHGVVRGGWLALRRLGRCHPWTAGGVDHVPPLRERVVTVAAPATGPAAAEAFTSTPTSLTGA
jgi:uncharacterized protein